jgi:hypothetical protein
MRQLKKGNAMKKYMLYGTMDRYYKRMKRQGLKVKIILVKLKSFSRCIHIGQRER